MLDKLLCNLWIHSFFGNRYNQTHCTSYFTKTDCIFLHDLKVEIRHHVLANWLCWFGLFFVVEKLSKQKYYVVYFSKIHCGYFKIRSVEKLDIMCYLIYCVDLWYIWSLKINLRRHTVWTISKKICFCCFMNWTVKKADSVC